MTVFLLAMLVCISQVAFCRERKEGTNVDIASISSIDSQAAVCYQEIKDQSQTFRQALHGRCKKSSGPSLRA